VAVVLLEHSQILVAELVGDLFDWHAGVGHERCGRMAELVRGPVVETDLGGNGTELSSAGRGVGGVPVGGGEEALLC
jgi:hypothetical protein